MNEATEEGGENQEGDETPEEGEVAIDTLLANLSNVSARKILANLFFRDAADWQTGYGYQSHDCHYVPQNPEAIENEKMLAEYAAQRTPRQFLSSEDEDGEQWPKIVDGIDLTKYEHLRDVDYDQFEVSSDNLVCCELL